MADYHGADLMDCEDEYDMLAFALKVEARSKEYIIHRDPSMIRRRHGRPSVPQWA